MACIDAFVLTKESANITSITPASIKVDVVPLFSTCEIECLCNTNSEVKVETYTAPTVSVGVDTNNLSVKYSIVCGIDDNTYINVQEGIIEINYLGNPVVWKVESNTDWIVIIKPWDNGENISVSYSGGGNGSAIFSSDKYEGIDRKTLAKFIGGEEKIERIVRQKGIRQAVKLKGGSILHMRNGGRFGVIKHNNNGRLQ